MQDFQNPSFRAAPSIDRRTFLRRAAAGPLAAGLAIGLPAAARLVAAEPRARITGYAACSWTLRDSSPGVFAVARKIGLDGVQADMGSPDSFHIDTAEKRAAYKKAAKESGVRVASVALGCLNNFPLATDARAPGWVAAGIEAAADFGVSVLLLAFFGKGELKTKEARERVGDILRELGPLAEKHKVRLGLENTLSARETLAIIERSKSPAVAVYYDSGNSRYWGHDAPGEIRALKERICEFHFKDGIKSYGDTRLGEGKVDFPAVARAIHAIGYRGWITLECHYRDLVPDMQYSLAFARKLMEARP
jgi:sugar phosphate isomerase/epimerase